MESTLTAKGQATIPKAVREYLRVEPGDRIKFFLHPDGSVVILPKIPTASLRGMLAKPGRNPVTLEAMDEAVRAGTNQSHSVNTE